MNKIVALLASFTMILGTQSVVAEELPEEEEYSIDSMFLEPIEKSYTSADRFLKGEEAIALIDEAHDIGIILWKNYNPKFGLSLEILLDFRYYQCNLKMYDQHCTDVTGYDGNYEK